MTRSIPTPDWRGLALHSGVLREPASEPDRLIVWLPTEREGDCQRWQRISTATRAAVVQHEGLSTVAATAIRARQRGRGIFGRLTRCFRRHAEELAWSLPNGETVEQFGARETGLLVVWTEEGSHGLDEPQIRDRWPQAARVQSLGPRLFVVWGVATLAAGRGVGSLLSDAEAQRHAEEWLVAARRSGDRSEEVSALADLGLLALEKGQIPLAVARLNEALVAAKGLGDQAREGDILGSLGLTVLEANQPEQACRYLEQALALVRAAGDRFAEKLILERLAAAQAGRGGGKGDITDIGRIGGVGVADRRRKGVNQ